MTVSLAYDPVLSRVRVSVGLTPLNANPYFETDASGWSAGGGTIGRSTAQAHQGTASLILTPDGVSAQAVARADVVLGVSGGARYRAATWVRCASARTVAVNIDWYTAGGGFLSTSAHPVAVGANVWTLLDFTATSPLTAGRAGLTVSMAGTPPGTDLLYIDEAGLYALLPAAADLARVERSTNGIQWVTVRGGGALAVTAGAAAVDDYEFTPGVPNIYRVSAVDTGPTAHVAAGTAAVSQNTGGVSTVSPGLPAGWEVGDLHLLLASIRNSGTGTVNTPAGWTPLVVSGNVALFGRRAEAADTAPIVTFAGGVAGASILAQIYGRRNAELVPVTTAAQLNASAQNIPYPGVNLDVDDLLVIVAGWKQDDFTSVATLPLGTEIAEINETGGDDASMVWDRIVLTTPVNIPAGQFVVTGGAAAISRALVAAFRPADFVTRQSASITPSLDRVWLKSLARPFLNRAVVVIDFSDIERTARGGVFDVVGRSLPVAVTDVRGSRRWSLDVLAPTAGEAADIDLLLASGDVLLIHVPADCDVPGGYVSIADTSQARTARRTVRRRFALPCTEVAPPGPDVVGATITCAGVLAIYATCADVLAAHATCADLLELIGSPTDVIVP